MNRNEALNENIHNPFLSNSLPALFVKTSLPIILVMGANGLFTLVDAYCLGKYVGSDALTAVTLMFPLYILLVAASTLVSSGYSSVLARLLGANAKKQANSAMISAISLALMVSVALILTFILFGQSLTSLLTNQESTLSTHGHQYLSILVFCSPISLLVSIGVDTFRSEGRMAEMMCITLLSTLLNFGLNYLFIVEMQWGVAGSALGTVGAQLWALLLAVFLLFRKGPNSALETTMRSISYEYCREFLILGVPLSFSYIGLSLIAGVTLYNLQVWAPDMYASTGGAYGIVTRLMTFVFLPILGLSLAFQSIVGNNYGASEFTRAKAALKIALTIALLYSSLAQIGLAIFKNEIGLLFVNDDLIISEIARILSINTLLLFIFGPLHMISTYFQAIGKAVEAAVLSLSRTYIFTFSLVMLLPYSMGEQGIWYAAPSSDILMVMLTATILYIVKKRSGSYLYLIKN